LLPQGLLVLLVLHPAISHAEAAKINPRKPSTTSLKVVAVAAVIAAAIVVVAGLPEIKLISD
jgi:hypothetical protein